MKKILAFSGSNSANSINQKLVTYAADQLSELEVSVIDLRDYPMPLYSIDIEKGEEGIPETAHALKALLDSHDGFIISVPEHNSSVPAFFKNTIDWISRINMRFFAHKPILLMGTSPGRGGVGSALLHSTKILSGHLSGEVVATFSLPGFAHNTELDAAGTMSLSNEDLRQELSEKLARFAGQVEQGRAIEAAG